MEKITVAQLLNKDLTAKVICFPTDTVYGIGCLYNDLEAIKKIFLIKQREATKPLVLLSPSNNITPYVKEIKPYAWQLIEQFWPGALTLIFKKSSLISDEITKGFSTVAFRMPNSKVALTILEKFGLMATTSVNISGEKELNNLDEISQKFSSMIDYLVIDQETLSLKPSKIIDVTEDEAKIIRN